MVRVFCLGGLKLYYRSPFISAYFWRRYWICQNNIREIDLFARFGGDEFALLLPESSCELAYTVTERIRKAVCTQAIDLNGIPVSITISSGIAVLTDEEETLDTLLSQADQALYAAKEAGRNQVVCHANS